MKNCILPIIFMLAITSAHAQDSLRICRQDTQIEDIMAVFEAMDINLYRFDLSGLLKHKYDVVFYIDEYRNGENTDKRQGFHLGTNKTPLSRYPAEDRDKLRKDHGLGPDDTEFDSITSVTIFSKEINDSSAMIYIGCPMAGSMKTSVKQYPTGPDSVYFYSSRPFRLDPVADTDTLDIPLVLYGSGWYDEQFDLTRFCGESEIDPGMKSDILQYIPHYYIIGADLIRKDDDRK